MTLISIPAKSTGAALRLLSQARSAKLQASYHPHGGTDACRDTPVSHTVWIMGPERKVRSFKESVR